MPILLYFFVIYFCGNWAFSSSRKHLLITLLRLEFIALVLYFPIYFYLCNFNYSMFRSGTWHDSNYQKCSQRAATGTAGLLTSLR